MTTTKQAAHSGPVPFAEFIGLLRSRAPADILNRLVHDGVQRNRSAKELACVNRVIEDLEHMYRATIGGFPARRFSLEEVIRYVNSQLASGC